MMLKTYHQILNPGICSCNMGSKNNVLRNLPFLQAASETTFSTLNTWMYSSGMTEGQEICADKSECGVFGVVARGAFKVYRQIKDDQSVIFDILTQGDFFLYGYPQTPGSRMFVYPDIIQAMTTSCLLTMNQKRLDPLLTGDPAIVPDFIAALTAKLAQTHDRFVRFLAFPAEKRIAFLLRFLYRKGPVRKDHPGLIPFNVTRKDLAAMAGLTLETVSRIMSGFERDGLLSSGRGWVEILEFDKLDLDHQAITI